MYVLKTAVMMLKIHRNDLQFNRYSHKKHILHCNNISNFTVYLIICENQLFQSFDWKCIFVPEAVLTENIP